MKGKLKSWIIAIIIIIILLIPIVVDYYNNKTIKVVSYDKYQSLVSGNDFALVYLGDVNDKSYTSTKETLIKMQQNFEINVKSLDNTKLSSEEKEELSSVNENLTKDYVYAFIKDKQVVYATAEDLTQTQLEKLINKYYNNIIPDEEITYKTVDSYDDFMKVVKSNKVVMSVFGRNTCSWCNKFKPIYNEVAAENKLDIYYLDSDSMDSTEHSKILSSGLKIPGTCTESGEEQPLSSSFGTPLTLFTKKGKVIGCISGYVAKDGLLSKLKSVGMLK